MCSKIVVFFALVALAYGRIIPNELDHSSQLESKGHGESSQSITLDHSIKSLDFEHDHHNPEHINAYPRYQYKYTVLDDVTGDEKTHSETRDGDNVQGEYSFVQPDGSLMTVTYTANAKDGFKANVKTISGTQNHLSQEHLKDFHNGHH